MRILKQLGVALLLCLTLPCSPALQARQDPVYQGTPSIAAARDLYERAHYDEARAMLDALISGGTRNAEIYWYRGLVEPDNTVAAERYFSRIINSYPRSAFADQARFRIARWYYDSGLYRTARDDFGAIGWRQGDSRLGQEARYWGGMTWIYSLSPTIPTEPDSVRTGLWQIKRVARNAVEPDLRGMAFNSIAEIYLALGQPDSTLVYAGQILEAPYLEDHHPRAFALQARAYDAMDDFTQAKGLYQIVLNRFADTWEGRQARRWLSEDQERAVQARIDTMRSTGVAVTAPSGIGEGNWTVQVGSYREMRNATETVLNLTGEKYPAWHKSELVNGVLHIRVYVGRFRTRTEARAFGNRMITESIHVTDFVPVDLSRR
ncbi:SPOR domain-containing protein [Gemmatimonadota bacterium]